ncbi:unnamed protein product, partial [Urochloa humidicola]
HSSKLDLPAFSRRPSGSGGRRPPASSFHGKNRSPARPFLQKQYEMAQNDECAPIQLDEQQLKKNPLWNHVVLLEKTSSGL